MKKSRFPFCLKRDAQCEIGYFSQIVKVRQGTNLTYPKEVVRSASEMSSQ